MTLLAYSAEHQKCKAFYMNGTAWLKSGLLHSSHHESLVFPTHHLTVFFTRPADASSQIGGAEHNLFIPYEH